MTTRGRFAGMLAGLVIITAAPAVLVMFAAAPAVLVMFAAAPAALVMFAAAPAAGQEVILFDKEPPSAGALADILFPENGGENAGKPKRKYRGITPRHPVRDDPPPAKQVGLMVNFEYNSAAILPRSLSYLDEIGRMMNLRRAAGGRLIIEGHTDSSGTDIYNLKLSERRAEAVRSYLIDRHRIDPSRLATAGKGEREPLMRDKPDHPANRRVQFRRAY